MSLKEKRQIEKLKKFIKSEVKASVLVNIVSSTIQDVANGMHPDNAQMTPFHTAGDIRADPTIKADPEFLSHVVAAATGRIFHSLMVRTGMTPNMVLPLIRMTEDEEAKAIKQLQSKYTN